MAEDKKQDIPGKPQVLEFEKNHVILFQGEKEYIMYKVLEGTVGLFLDYGTASQVMLETLHAGQLFGEMALLQHRPRTATAVALEQTSVVPYPDIDITRICEDDPQLAMEIMSSLGDMLSAALGKLENIHGTLMDTHGIADTEEDIPTGTERIDRFLREHTAYDDDGKPYFLMKV